jgi:hypothetical protein
VLGRDFQVQALAADQGMIEEDVAGQQKTIRRKNRDPLPVGLDRHRTPDAHETPPPAVGSQARAAQQIDERQSASVQNGNFQVVDLHISIVDSHAVEHAQ